MFVISRIVSSFSSSVGPWLCGRLLQCVYLSAALYIGTYR